MLKSITSAPAYNNVIIVNDYTTLADIVLPIVDLLCNSESLFGRTFKLWLLSSYVVCRLSVCDTSVLVAGTSL